MTDPDSREKGKVRKLYPKRGYDGQATPSGPVANAPAGGGIGGGLNLDWDAIKNGRDGASARNQRSKQRGKGKNHRRDK